MFRGRQSSLPRDQFLKLGSVSSAQFYVTAMTHFTCGILVYSRDNWTQFALRLPDSPA